MEVHKPKGARNWREFLAEIGTIVIGVLIALAAEQVAQALHERHVAAEARENVRAEAALDIDFIQGRARSQACIDKRIDDLTAILTRAQDGALAPKPTWIGHPPTTPMFTERWRSATASGRSSLFAANEQDAFDNLYGLFVRIDDHQQREQAVWSHLRALETWNGPLGPAARLAFAQALQDARYEAWDLKFSGAIALQRAAAMGIKPKADPTDDGMLSICLPLGTSRAQALETLKGPFGEP